MKVSVERFQKLYDFNMELLESNVRIAKRLMKYCEENELPSPLDPELAYRVQQLADIYDEIHHSPDGSFQKKDRRGLSRTLRLTLREAA